MIADARHAFDSNRVLLLDGGLGTELERRGFKTLLPYWSADATREASELLLSIHRDYVDAGADIIVANTFRTTYHLFARTNQAAVADQLTRQAVDIARQATLHSSRSVLVAASVAPLEDCYSPEDVPDDTTLEHSHRAQIASIAGSNPDLVMLETMISIRELKIAMGILQQYELPFIVSLTTDRQGNLLDGTELSDVIKTIETFGPMAISINCRPIAEINIAFDKLCSNYSGPKGIYANGSGEPGGETGWLWHENQHSISSYCQHAQDWMLKGAQLVGGCCGTSPELIAALRPEIDKFNDRLQSQSLADHQ